MRELKLRNSSHKLITTAMLTARLAVSKPCITVARQVTPQSDLTAVSQRIRDEALARSRIMDYAFHLSDVCGPRLTGSPNSQAAGEGAVRELKQMGLSGIVKEPIPNFRYGWVNTRFLLAITAPSFAPLIKVPLAWSTGTAGPPSLRHISRFIMSSHFVTKLDHVALVGFHLRQMQRDLFVELAEEWDPFTNQDRQDRIANFVG